MIAVVVRSIREARYNSVGPIAQLCPAPTAALRNASEAHPGFAARRLSAVGRSRFVGGRPTVLGCDYRRYSAANDGRARYRILPVNSACAARSVVAHPVQMHDDAARGEWCGVLRTGAGGRKRSNRNRSNRAGSGSASRENLARSPRRARRSPRCGKESARNAARACTQLKSLGPFPGRTPRSAVRSVLDVRDEREPAVRHEVPAMRRSQPAIW